MMTTGTLEALLLGATLCALLLGAALVVRQTAGGPRPRALGLYFVAIAAAVAQLASALPIDALWWEPVLWALRGLGVLNVAAGWAFACALLVDGWRFTPPRVLFAVALIASPGLYLLADVGFASTSLAAAWSPWGAVPGVIAALHLVVLAGLGAADDLVDQRLRLRRGFVIVVATGLVGVLAAESLGSALGEILRLSIALGVAVAAALTLATWPREAWGAVPTPVAGASEASTQDPADAIDVARLERLMLEERPYLDAELDLGRLSARLAMPPHRLRRLINRRLGYRNFADFLAEARLTEVKRRLADPALARRPILSIALESGFPSLATFNRVFKARENSTPSAFRRAALGAQSQKEATQDAE